MFDARKPTLALALSAVLMFSGCIGNGDGDTLDFLSDDDEVSASDNLVIELSAANASSDIAHIGFEFDGIFAHDANTSFPDGYHEVSLAADRADVVAGGATQGSTVASGELPVGTYDQVLFRLTGAQAHGAEAMGDHGHGGSDDGHGHGDDSADGHGHGHGDGADGASSASKSKLSVTANDVDIPLNVTFDLVEDEATTVEIVLDVGASTTESSFQPVFDVTVTRGDETLESLEGVGVDASYGDDAPATPRPAARMAVFAPNGDQVYEPSFDPEQKAFVNTKSNPYRLGETLRFSGTESEAVATGATIASYTWDFDDGNTTTGPSVQHAYEQQGVFEVTLTVEDSNGVTGEHTLRVVVLQEAWTASVAEEGFEDGAGDWATSTTGGDLGVPFTGASAPSPFETSWALDAEGHNSSTAWHVGNHDVHTFPAPVEGTVTSQALGYNSNVQATLSSPSFEIPADWSSAGYSFYVAGASESGFDPLVVTYNASDGTGGTIAEIDATSGWTHFEDLGGLSELAGKTVTFTFTFTSDGNTEHGPGFYVDDFSLGGVDLPLHKAHLLEEGGGHGGHDHSH